MKPLLPLDEEERLQQLHRYAILDTPAESAFDRVVHLAQRLFDVPVAFVSFVDRDRQWFKSCCGIEASETAREVAFCAHAILSDEVMVVPDATLDPRFADSPCVTGQGCLRFYAGAPLTLREGFHIGTVGIMDTQPRDFSAFDVALLRDLAAIVVDGLERRLLVPAGETGEAPLIEELPASLRERFEPWVEHRTAQWASANRALQVEVAHRKRIEARLRASENRYRQVVDQSPDTIVVADSSGTIIEINPAAHEMLGYEYAEVIGRHVTAFDLPEDRAEDAANLERLAQGESKLIERWMRRKDGSRLPVEVSISPIGNGLIQATARDITERKRAQTALLEANEALEARVRSRTLELDAAIGKLHLEIAERQEAQSALLESNRRLTTTLESISDGFFSLDTQWRFTYLNALAEKMTGNSRQELMGKRFQDAFPHSAQSRFYSAYQRAMTEGVPTTAEDFSVASGSWYQVRCYPSPEGISVYFQDISDRKEAERKLQEAKEAAECANGAKTEFLSRMSHELRTPMNAILGFAQLFELDEMNEDDRENIEQILHGGNHLLGLINEVLDVARVESGQVTLSIEPVAAGEVTQEAIGLVQRLAAARGIEIVSAMGDDGPYVLADRQRFKQVMLNLLSNAIKYNREGGRVFISGSVSDAGYLRIAVRDTGRGIEAEGLQKLFTPFERLGAEASDIEGTGIGLALSKRLMELMSGSIGVESVAEPGHFGQGSTFWIELPHTENPHREAAGETQIACPNAQFTVLYIEDNLSNLKLVERIMSKRSDIKLVAAMQGEIGIALARQHHPTLILLDAHLPDLSGHEVLCRLRASEDTRDIPVMVISADATPQQIERLREAGAVEYLTKPLNVRRFLSVLGEHLTPQSTPFLISVPGPTRPGGFSSHARH